MASASKSKTLTNNYGNGYTLTASFQTNGDPNVANNTTNVTCTATFSSDVTNWETSYPSTLIIYWHDNRENYDRQVASINFSGIAKYSSKTASGTINVTHKDDGTLSGYAKAVFTKGNTTTSWACNSGDVQTDLTALTTIPRASVPTLDKTTFNIGDTITIYTNRKSTAFTHTVTLYFGTYSYQIATGVTDSVTFDTSTIANQMYQQIPNASEGEGNVTIETYNGGTSIGNKNVIFNAKVTNSSPTFNQEYLDINTAVTNITGNNQWIVRNKSNLEIVITNAEAKNYATLSSTEAIINGVTYTGEFRGYNSTIDVGTLNLSSNVTAQVSVIDSRGIKTTKNLNITILDWVQPSAIILLERENNYYSETNINVNAEYSSLNSVNTITIKVREKKTGTSTWSAYTTLQDEVTTQLTLDNEYAWDVQVSVQDAFATTTYNLSVGRGIPILYIDRLKRSLGIDCFPANQESLEIAGKTIADIIYPVGSIYLSVNNTNPSSLFGGTWVQIEDTFLMASGSTYTAGSTGGSATHNHLTPLGFDENALYGYSTYQNGEYLPAYNSTVLQGVNRVHTNITSDTGAIRIAYTDSSSSIPPYLAVYVWKRTA